MIKTTTPILKNNKIMNDQITPDQRHIKPMTAPSTPSWFKQAKEFNLYYCALSKIKRKWYTLNFNSLAIWFLPLLHHVSPCIFQLPPQRVRMERRVMVVAVVVNLLCVCEIIVLLCHCCVFVLCCRVVVLLSPCCCVVVLLCHCVFIWLFGCAVVGWLCRCVVACVVARATDVASTRRYHLETFRWLAVRVVF